MKRSARSLLCSLMLGMTVATAAPVLGLQALAQVISEWPEFSIEETS